MSHKQKLALISRMKLVGSQAYKQKVARLERFKKAAKTTKEIADWDKKVIATKKEWDAISMEAINTGTGRGSTSKKKDFGGAALVGAAVGGAAAGAVAGGSMARAQAQAKARTKIQEAERKKTPVKSNTNAQRKKPVKRTPVKRTPVKSDTKAQREKDMRAARQKGLRRRAAAEAGKVDMGRGKSRVSMGKKPPRGF